MNINKIEFPNPPVYYILRRSLSQPQPTDYNFLKTDQVLATTAKYIQPFEDFNLWKIELATYGITVQLNSDGKWYKIE